MQGLYFLLTQFYILFEDNLNLKLNENLIWFKREKYKNAQWNRR